MVIISSRFLSFICFFGIVISRTTAQPSFLKYFCMKDKGNYTANSTYQTNLYTLLSNLSSNTQIDYGFYNFSLGQNSDQVHAIGLCRGDVKPDVCRSCLNDSRLLLTQLCPNQKEVIGWYDECMLRYSNRSIFGIMEAAPWFYMWNSTHATDVDNFNRALRGLLDRLINTAASGDSLRKYAAANVTVPNIQTIYGLLQCTPDLSEQECYECLGGASTDIPTCCGGKIGAGVVRASCYIRFENFSFFEPTTDASPPSPTKVSPPPSTNSNPTEGKSNTSPTVIAVVVSIVAFILLLIFICIYLRLRKPCTKLESETIADDEEIESIETLQFDFGTIEVATNNFSDENKLGQGGFGAVYKGKLSNGQEVAVKRLSKESVQGDMEFQNEVLLVAKLQHRNLVRLLGFCLKRRERIKRLLIYEFVPNKSLDYFIFDPIQHFHLNWQTRYKIIKGIARGLFYLHEDSCLRIIHRDLKASNILLDEEMNPKILDFGITRLLQTDQSCVNTNRIVGTHGYMAPEYAIRGHFSIKSDIFSFGVLILEIVSGFKNNEIHGGSNIEHLVSFVWRNWREGTASTIVDSTLNGASTNEIMKCIHIGLLCVQQNAAKRPSMASVMLMLDSNSATLPRPSQPAFVLHGRGFTETQSVERNSELGDSASSNDIQASVNEASNTELYPR